MLKSMFEHIQIRRDMISVENTSRDMISVPRPIFDGILRVRYMFYVHCIKPMVAGSPVRVRAGLSVSDKLWNRFWICKLSDFIECKVADTMACRHLESSIRNQMIRITLFDHYRTENLMTLKRALLKPLQEVIQDVVRAQIRKYWYQWDSNKDNLHCNLFQSKSICTDTCWSRSVCYSEVLDMCGTFLSIRNKTEALSSTDTNNSATLFKHWEIPMQDPLQK